MKNSKGIVIGSIAATGITLLYLWRRYYARKGKWIEVAQVDKLYIHPVKSCRGISVNSCTAESRGVYANGSTIGDRSFMVIHDNGRFANINQFPSMVLITPTFTSAEELLLSAPNMGPISVKVPRLGSTPARNYKLWGTPCPGIDCGDKIARWLQDFTKGNNTRLVYHNRKLPSRKTTEFMKFGHLGLYDKGPMESMFQEYSAFNLVSQASLDVLNSKLDRDHQVDERYFRTNVLLKGCVAFAEDKWSRIRIGKAEFQFAKHTNRCRVTTVNPDTGVADKDCNTLTSLSSFCLCPPEEKPVYGIKPKIAADFVVERAGKISVGDKVYLYLSDANL